MIVKDFALALLGFFRRSSMERRDSTALAVLSSIRELAKTFETFDFEITNLRSVMEYRFILPDGVCAVGNIDRSAHSALMSYLADQSYSTVKDGKAFYIFQVADNHFRVSDSTRVTQVRPVLLVDDDLTFGAVLKRFLLKHGFTTVHVTDGCKAFELIRDGLIVPSVVICDVHMPILSGHDLIMRIRSQPAFRGIPVIMLTSDNSVELQISFIERDVDAFLSKNDDPRLLCAHVSRLVGTK